MDKESDALTPFEKRDLGGFKNQPAAGTYGKRYFAGKLKKGRTCRLITK
jgi:hypothetical protein